MQFYNNSGCQAKVPVILSQGEICYLTVAHDLGNIRRKRGAVWP